MFTENSKPITKWREKAIETAETTGEKTCFCPECNSEFHFSIVKWHQKYFYVLGGDCSNKECGYGLIRNPPKKGYYKKYEKTKSWWQLW